MNQNPNQRPRQNNRRPNQNRQPNQKNQAQKSGEQSNRSQALSLKNSETSRGQAIRASRRSRDLADKVLDGANLADQNSTRKRANLLPIKNENKLRVTHLGGQDGIGEKNMIVIEYGDEAIVTDCGNELGLDLPGINYSVPDVSYLETIKHKIKAYVISHGHLDHIGGLPHILPKYPAPIYGSIFTIGMVQKTLGNHQNTADILDEFSYNEMNMDNHERLMVGKHFTIELVRITHSIPESSLIVVDTPLGRVINTGDFRLDPEPLDSRPSDLERIKELGKDGVLLLMSDSTNSQRPGRTPTEHTLQDSFHDVIKNAPGRIMVASFSSNINRVQMIINSASEAGRKVAIDGRSMIQHVELAVKLGLLRVPKNTIVAMAQAVNLPDEKVLVMCTGGQGENGAALPRMSIGEHKHIKLREGDTVVISSTPIPGNEVAYEQLGNDLIKLGVFLFRAPTWEVDGCSGPLHVSGHAFRDEHKDMIEMCKPKYFTPIYAGAFNRKHHQNVAIEMATMPRDRTFMVDNGDVLEIDENLAAKLHKDAVSHGSVLVDDSGQTVPSVVVKDRLLLSETGLVVVVLTIDRRTGGLLTSPDIITRGFIYIRDNEELMNLFRGELRRAVSQRYKRVDLDRFKAELKDHVTHFLFDQTQRSPIVIPVINVVGGRKGSDGKEQPATNKDVEDQQKRFAELRAAIRSQDQRD
ncbi:ribonuclease J [Candidatus Saccharibacteria bacterium]|nr:ribonuclease J [Candidatus Saccharibacteria bacterium]MCB9821203.1 ribonuclease J [Candidatus Nomurabacteria bacterium]